MSSVLTSSPFPLGLNQCDHWKNRIEAQSENLKLKMAKHNIFSSDLSAGEVVSDGLYTHVYLLVSYVPPFFFVPLSFLPRTEAHFHVITAKLWMRWCRAMLCGVLETVYLSEMKSSSGGIVFCSVLAKTNMKMFCVCEWGRTGRARITKWRSMKCFLAHSYPKWSEAGHYCSPSSSDNFTAG